MGMKIGARQGARVRDSEAGRRGKMGWGKRREEERQNGRERDRLTP